jgi:hypothetical protein
MYLRNVPITVPPAGGDAEVKPIDVGTLRLLKR